MRLRSLLVAALVLASPTVTSVVGPATTAVAASVTATATADTATADTLPDDGSGTIAENPFLPEERDLGECSSSLPKPDCGSEAQGGWHQGIVFAVLMLGMAFIGWRIFRAVRRADRRMPDAPA